MARNPTARALALCAVLAQGAADAASATATIQVGLTLAVSCRVDSGTLTSRGTSEIKRKAAVVCGAEAPFAVNTSIESPGAELERRLDLQTPAGPVRVVTLVF